MKKNVYLYLTQEDKTQLRINALKKMKSLSCYVAIVCKYYNIFCLMNNAKDNERIIKNYITKGKKKTLVVIGQIKKELADNVNDMNYTNAIYLYLHQEKVNELFKGQLSTQKLNRQIQSELDKTYDPTFMKNEIIRNQYRINHMKGNQTCKH